MNYSDNSDVLFDPELVKVILGNWLKRGKLLTSMDYLVNIFYSVTHHFK